MTDEDKVELTEIIRLLKSEQRLDTQLNYCNTLDMLKKVLKHDPLSHFSILMNFRPGCPVKHRYVKKFPKYAGYVYQNPHECDEWDRAYLAAIMNHLFYKHEWTINEVIHWLEIDILQVVEK